MIKFDAQRLAAILLVWGVAGLVATARATVVDLTGNNNSGTANGAEFDYTPAQPTGTEVIEPFLRLQADPTEQGYIGGTFDDKAESGRSISFSLKTITVSVTERLISGPARRQRAGGNKSLISLDVIPPSSQAQRLEFYTSPVGSKTKTDVPSWARSVGAWIRTTAMCSSMPRAMGQRIGRHVCFYSVSFCRRLAFNVTFVSSHVWQSDGSRWV